MRNSVTSALILKKSILVIRAGPLRPKNEFPRLLGACPKERSRGQSFGLKDSSSDLGTRRFSDLVTQRPSTTQESALEPWPHRVKPWRLAFSKMSERRGRHWELRAKRRERSAELAGRRPAEPGRDSRWNLRLRLQPSKRAFALRVPLSRCAA